MLIPPLSVACLANVADTIHVRASSPPHPHIVRVFEAVDDACALMRAGCADCVSFLDNGRRFLLADTADHTKRTVNEGLLWR